MRLMIFILFMFACFAALAISFLPLWLSIPLVLLTGIPLIWVIWKVRKFIKGLKAALADLIPSEKKETVIAGDTYQGQEFAFTFPVACEVSQTRIQDVEALLLKPKFDFADAPKDSLMVASTFTRAELKEKINGVVEKIFSQIEDSQREESTPVKVGPFEGERRAFAAAKDGKSVKGEAVYLDIEKGSIVWVAIAPDDKFDLLATKYRELAVLIRRTESNRPALEQPVIDV